MHRQILAIILVLVSCIYLFSVYGQATTAFSDRYQQNTFLHQTDTTAANKVLTQTSVFGGDFLSKSDQNYSASERADLALLVELFAAGAKNLPIEFAWTLLKRNPNNSSAYFVYAIVSQYEPSNDKFSQFLQEQLNSQYKNIHAKNLKDFFALTIACANFRLFLCAQAQYFSAVEWQKLFQLPETKFAVEQIGWQLSLRSFQYGYWSIAWETLQSIKTMSLPPAQEDLRQFMTSRLLFELKLQDQQVSEVLAEYADNENINLIDRIAFFLALAEDEPAGKDRTLLLQTIERIAVSEEAKEFLALERAERLYARSLDEAYVPDKQSVQSAIEVFTAAMEERPTDVREIYLMKRAWLFQIIGENALAQQDWQQMTRSENPNNVQDSYLLMGNMFSRQKNYFSANFLLQQGIEAIEDPRRKSELRAAKIENYYLNDQCNYLRNEYRKTDWEEYPANRDRVNYFQAECYRKQQNWQEAKRYYALLPQDAPYPFGLHYYQALLHKGTSEEIQAWKQTLLQQETKLSDIQLVEWQYLVTQENYEPANIFFSQIYSTLTTVEQKILWLNEAKPFFQKIKNYSSLAFVYEELSGIYPENTDYYTEETSKLFLAAEQPDRALQVWEKYFSQGGLAQRHRAQWNIARIQKDYFANNLEAIKQLQPILAEQSSSWYVPAVSLTVEAAIADQNLSVARSTLESHLPKIAASDPAREPLSFRYAEVLQALEKYALSLRGYQQYTQEFPNGKHFKQAQKNASALQKYLKSQSGKEN